VQVSGRGDGGVCVCVVVVGGGVFGTLGYGSSMSVWVMWLLVMAVVVVVVWWWRCFGGDG